VTTLFAFALCAASVNGTAAHFIDVVALVESSDLIISGRVTNVVEQGTAATGMATGSQPNRKLLAVIAPDETLKGSTETSKLSVEFFMGDRSYGSRAILPGQYGIFFLLKGASNYKASDPSFPFLPAVPNGRPFKGPPLDRVITKLGETLMDKHSSESDISAALEALSTIQNKLATETLRTALETTNGDIQVRVASKLIARNDLDGLDLVEKSLLYPAGRSTYLLETLAGSLGGLKDPRAIPALKRLLETNDQRIVKGAAIALRQSGSADALDPLSHLLNNGDEQVRYYAVVGLGEITRQDEWTPTFPEFRQHEDKYLSYWRGWTESNLPHQARK